MATKNFTHLHVHSHYSVLDGMSKVPELVDKCLNSGMNAIALTDHGNMFGIKELTDYVKKVNKKNKEKATEQGTDFQPFKAIIGIEAYCARRGLHSKDNKETFITGDGKQIPIDRSGYHLILLAKNKTGYQNLCKLSSIAFTEGYFYRPRIDKEILEKYHEGLIVASACLGGELPQLIMDKKIEEAEAVASWFKSIFGDDYYIELQRHPATDENADKNVYERQKEVNPILVEIANKLNIKTIATNDVHFVEQEHAEAHDRLICLSTGKNLDDADRMHYTKQEWLKTPDEMSLLFSDMPEALENTQEIVDKVETYSIESGPIMPVFDIPESFGTEEEYRKKYTDEDIFNEFTRNENGEVVLTEEKGREKIDKLGGIQKLYRTKLEADYLAKLAWEGAEKRYGKDLTDEQKERIKFELHIMKTMGFPGYFLIVSDYIRAAREELGVSVGPGRGSAAGSVVAYCLKITDIDPLKYDLLFERFLNPDRISLPDIDVDFDDEGRAKVLDWVTKKYGKEKVAHIITYGTMATKSSLADVARVQGVPLTDVNRFKSLIPEKFDDIIDPETGKSFSSNKDKKVPKVNLNNCIKYVPALKDAANGEDKNVASMFHYASELEDTIRQIGVHACGVIIGADDLQKFAPLCTVKDQKTGENLLVTQYDGHVIESVGLIKMDFLGLLTLSIIKEAVKNIKLTTGKELDIDKIPIDDKETYKLFAEGRTTGVFQFESPGMKKYLRELQPTVFEDLIAMNALYRPGPMEYIPQFIRRKHGEEAIDYDIPIMEQYLKDTYGVTVYQEQVMLLSRLLGGFTRGESDALRKAMGKKIINILNELKPKFIDGGKKNGHDEKTLNKIWNDWEAFASYAFNKSHATCYAWVAYQTAYLKAHYPAEFMAANLTQNLDSIKDVTKFMEECKAMKLAVKSPNVNESQYNFGVNAEGEILFGLGGIKGVGGAAVEAIIKEREENGPYEDIYDFIERVNLSACNKKVIESLAVSGAFDCFGLQREQFFETVSEVSGTEVLIKYGTTFQADKTANANSLFGGGSNEVDVMRPKLWDVKVPWSDIERLNKEREVVGIYLSSHPLDQFAFELKYLVNTPMADLDDANLSKLSGRTIICGGIVTGVKQGISKKGSPYLVATLEDASGKGEVPLFGRDYDKFFQLFQKDASICVFMSVFADTRFGDSGRYMKQIKKVMPLSNLINDPGITGMTLTLDLERIPDYITDYMGYFLTDSTNGTGRKFPFNIIVYDKTERCDLHLSSQSYRMQINDNLMDLVSDTDGVDLCVGWR